MNAPLYLVLDVQTVTSAQSDRIIEIGAVLLDSQFNVQSIWETLIDPDCEVSDSETQGIDPDELFDAPYFDYIAKRLALLLQGRIIIAQHLERVSEVLYNEYKRLEVELPDAGWGIDIEQYCYDVENGESVTLEECLVEREIYRVNPPSALANAVAITAFVRDIVHGSDPVDFHGEALELPTEQLALLDDDQLEPVPRSISEDQCENRRHWLEKFTPNHDVRLDAAATAYLEFLLNQLVEGRLNTIDQVALIRKATELGLFSRDTRELHHWLLRHVTLKTLLGGDFESEHLQAIAQELGIQHNPFATILADPPKLEQLPKLSAGDAIAFVGTTEICREEWQEIAYSVGLQISGLHQGTVLVIAGDIESQTAPMQLARSLEVPIIDEATFAVIVQAMNQIEDDGSAPEVLRSNIDIVEFFPWAPEAAQDAESLTAAWLQAHGNDSLSSISNTVELAILPEDIDLEFTVAHIAETTDRSSLGIKTLVYDLILQILDIAGASFPEQSDANHDSLDSGNSPKGAGSVGGDHAKVQKRLGDNREASNTRSQIELLIGWLDLLGKWPAPHQVGIALPATIATAISDIEQPGQALIEQAFHEVEQVLEKDTERRSAIISGRATGALNLQTLGDQFGVTRERVRQLEVALRKELQTQNPACETVINACASRFMPCASVAEIFNIMPGLGETIEPNTSHNLLEVLTWVHGVPGVEFSQGCTIQWQITDGWIIFGDFIQAAEESTQSAVDHYGLLLESQLVAELMERFPAGSPERILKYFTDKLGFIRRGPYLLPPRSSVVGQIAVELAINGAPMTTDQLHKVMPDRSRSAIEQVLERSDIFINFDQDSWALQEWGVVQAKHRREVEQPLEPGAEFSPEETKDLYYHDELWMLLIKVEQQHLEQTEFSVPLGIGQLYNLQPEEAIEIPSRFGPHTLRRGATECTLSTPRRFLHQLEANIGDRVWLVFGEFFEVRPALPVEQGLVGLAALANAMALEPGTRLETLAQINVALGLEVDAPRRQAVRRLRNRDEDHFAEILRQA
ncbi:exonuclease domain-containing protein [Corynebacterium freiburgense]|uniref:exonuclease domain-containing protein n=1 Tax=Corynebacterium freiburgense TaxID=556548 RepID=UPI00040BE7A7|nr:exonuclease domain-containing protein [Corynebacterium freiburgense]WJZ03355.1 DNA polymerase III subunit epsilon [Corynebacterium freiburgense]